MSSSCSKVIWVPVEYLEYGENFNVVFMYQSFMGPCRISTIWQIVEYRLHVPKLYGFPEEYLEYGK